MDMKLAQHLNMKKDWMLLQLMEKRHKDAAHEVTLYESAHGYGFDDEYDEGMYTRWTDNDDGFKRLWHEQCKALDDWRECLDRFCESMVRFTDGQIDYKTARTMATNPRWAAKLDEIMAGKVA